MSLLNINAKTKKIDKRDYTLFNFYIIKLSSNEIVFDKTIHKKSDMITFTKELEEFSNQIFGSKKFIFNGFNVNDVFNFNEDFNLESKFNLANKGYLVLSNRLNVIDKTALDKALKQEANKTETLVQHLVNKTSIPESDIRFFLKKTESLNFDSLYFFVKKIMKLNSKYSQRQMIND